MFSLLQQLSQGLAQVPLASPNATAAAGDVPSITGILSISDMKSLWAFVASFSMLRDWIKLFFLGTVLETIRRFAGSIWHSVIDAWFLSATFESDDDAYNWMMVWIAQQPVWSSARDVQISTKGWGINDYSSIHIPGEQDDRGSLEKRRLNYLPSFGLTQTLWYKRRWIRFTRSRRALQDGDTTEVLRLHILTRSHNILNELLLEAKKSYEKEEQHRVSIYVASPYNDWRRSGSRPKRPMDSIVLDEGVKDMVLNDAQEFMGSEKWYSERGLPYRRGYLFHGCPGSGKTSLVHAIAGALNLDIYIINLSKKGLDDSGLTELVADLPARSVALIEEIDAAFQRTVSRDATNTTTTTTSASATSDSAGVTLSGLLTSIDGIQASEGRLLFATTNKYHALDPALTRPGRMDVHVEFTFASKSQAEELFKRFFHASDKPELEIVEKKPVPKVEVPSKYPPVKSPLLSLDERDSLAREFAEAMPDREFAMASIQGLLMNFKSRPAEVIGEIPSWVEKERAARKERELALKEAEKKAAEKKRVEDPAETDSKPSNADNVSAADDASDKS